MQGISNNSPFILIIFSTPTAMVFTADQAMQLLDFSKKLDINLLDRVVDCFYNGTGENVSCSWSPSAGLCGGLSSVP